MKAIHYQQRIIYLTDDEVKKAIFDYVHRLGYHPEESETIKITAGNVNPVTVTLQKEFTP